jgi:hypothetical protein
LIAAFDPCIGFTLELEQHRARTLFMHEVSLAGGILSAVEAAARRDPFVRVSRLRLEAGRWPALKSRRCVSPSKHWRQAPCWPVRRSILNNPGPGLVPGLRRQRGADRARRRLPAVRRLLAATHRRD